MTPAIFGISNSGLNLVVSLMVLSLVAIWLSLIYWTYEDARRRIEDPMLVWIFTAWSLFPFIGTMIYLIIRPPEFLEDMREREIETKAAEARLHMLQNRTCSNCGYEVESSYLRCPSCLRKLKEPCESCNKPLDPRWRVCPFCETEVKRARPAAAAARRGRSGRPSESEAAQESAKQRSSAAERSAARRTAAERQKRSLSSVSADGTESNGPAPKPKPSNAGEEGERLPAAAVIGPKRDAEGAKPAGDSKPADSRPEAPVSEEASTDKPGPTRPSSASSGKARSPRNS